MLALSLIAVALASAALWASVKIVPQGEHWTVERFGKYTQTLPSGLHFTIPVIDRIGERVNMMERLLETGHIDVITRDNAVVSADAVTFYQVTNAARAAYEVFDLHEAILNLATTNIRSVIGAMDMDEVLSDREGINEKLLRAIDEATHAWGVKATRVEIRDLLPPKDITEAMARQIKAEREKRAEILEAEAAKQSAVLRAQGRKEAAFLEAEAREREAAAEASATAQVSQAIRDGEAQAIQYFVAQRYVDSLKDIAAARNSKLVVLPMESAGLIGSVAGVTELLKGFKQNGAAPADNEPTAPPRPRLVD